MKRKQNYLIAGLDIGSTAVRLAVGQLVERDGGTMDVQILGAAESPSEGVHRGVINSIEDVVSSISACLEQAERIVGAPVQSVFLGISDTNIITQQTKGVVAVSKADEEISEADVERATDAARSIATPLNYEVLHVLPRHYSVDGQGGIKNPVGMTGVRLELDAQMVLGSSSQIKNITKSVYRAGLEIDGLVFSVLATAEAVITNKQKELGVAVVNIGGSTTSVVVFEEGQVITVAVLPIGSEHITNDIAIGLRTSIDIAERVKLEFGDCLTDSVSKRDLIDLTELGSATKEIVKRRDVSEIIGARVEEILYKVDQELKRVQKSGLLPAGVVFTGGGAKLSGIPDVAKKVLRLPSMIGYPINMASVSDKINDLGFATAVGLVRWGSEAHGEGYSAGERKETRSTNRWGGKMREWMRLIMP